MGKTARWLIFCGVALGFLSGPGLAPAATKVRFTLNFIPYGIHTPWYAGLEKGFFREEGIDLEIIPGKGSSLAAKRVGTDQADFGVSDTNSILYGIVEGLPIKIVGMYFDDGPTAIYSFASKPVRKPKDLEGIRFGTTRGGSNEEIMPAFAEINRIDMSKVKQIPMTASAVVPTFFAGKTDAILTFVTVGVTVFAKAKEVGKEVVEMRYKDWGIDVYGLAIAGSTKFIKSNPEAAAAFMRATYKSLAWSFSHVDEATDLFRSKHPQVSRDLAKGHLLVSRDLALTTGARKVGIGRVDEKKMRYTRDLLFKSRNITKRLPLEDIYTNEFVPRIDFPK